jgi:hypothetical protein
MSPTYGGEPQRAALRRSRSRGRLLSEIGANGEELLPTYGFLRSLKPVEAPAILANDEFQALPNRDRFFVGGMAPAESSARRMATFLANDCSTTGPKSTYRTRLPVTRGTYSPTVLDCKSTTAQPGTTLSAAVQLITASAPVAPARSGAWNQVVDLLRVERGRVRTVDAPAGSLPHAGQRE